jgi:hypothetical protein
MLKIKVVWILISTLFISGLNSQAAQQGQCSALEYRQFDFWVGDWDVLDANTQLRVGRNTVQNLLNGCMIQENWADKVDAPGGRAISQNYYDPNDKQWHQIYVDNNGQGALILSGGFNNGAMILESDRFLRSNLDLTSLQRITWTMVNNNPDKVRQLGETSSDNGKTWQVSFNALYIRKKQ